MEMKIIKENEVNLELAFIGKLDTNGADVVAHWFYGLLNDIKKDVIIDFTGVTYLSSAGIRLLLSGWKMASKQGHKLYLTDPKPDIINLLKMAGLNHFLL
ncbi:MAG: STAS domain-containing protein [Bacteroidales bacterium]|jgi:anti-sigma B factor antagonist/stage II sporulation protein AA (anti-sigma F factor antagonist)